MLYVKVVDINCNEKSFYCCGIFIKLIVPHIPPYRENNPHQINEIENAINKSTNNNKNKSSNESSFKDNTSKNQIEPVKETNESVAHSKLKKQSNSNETEEANSPPTMYKLAFKIKKLTETKKPSFETHASTSKEMTLINKSNSLETQDKNLISSIITNDFEMEDSTDCVGKHIKK